MRAFNSISISRAGAVAAVVASRKIRRVLPFATSLGLMVGGSVVIGFGAAATLATGLGPGPFDVLIAGVSEQTGLPFALSLWLLAGTLTVLAALLGNRPGLGTIVAPLIIGPVIGWCSGAIRTVLAFAIEPGSEAAGLGVVWQQRPSEVVAAFVVHLLGVVLIGVGAGALIASGLGAGTADLLTAATSSKLGRSVPLVRTAFELAFLGFGLILGGPAGFGTILVAVTIGPSVRFGHARVDAAISRVAPNDPVADPVADLVGDSAQGAIAETGKDAGVASGERLVTRNAESRQPSL
ncbi:MAG: YczE/YyaS/YitT family protein [Acidimicrobiales bacterium]